MCHMGMCLSYRFFLSVQVGEALAMSCFQSKICDLKCSVQLVEAVLFYSNVYTFVAVLFNVLRTPS